MIKKKLQQLYWSLKYNEVPYHPKSLFTPPNLLDTKSSWKGNELIIKDIIELTGINTKSCLEFGVDNAFSTVVFSNFFDSVIGVDIFVGDIHSGTHEDDYDVVKESIKAFKNISLVKSDYKDFIKNNDNEFYDLIHIDIIHTYEDTFKCGLWAANHSNCVLFHDTVSFREVIRAVKDISKITGKKFYNYREIHGLGIIF